MADIYKTAEGRRMVEDAYRQCLAAWPVPSRHVRLPTRQGETFAVTCGPDDAPPLILLHGSAANAASWPALLDIAALARHYRVVAVDIIGEAGFSAPSRPAMDGDAHALWLDDVLDGLGAPRAALLGTSLGGWLAIDFASRRPARAEAVIAQCPGGLAPRKFGYMIPVLALGMMGSWGRGKAMRLILGAHADAPAPDGGRFNALMALVMRHIVLRKHAIPVFSDEALGALSMPVLAILGARDRIIDSPKSCARLQRCVPDARVRWLPEAGHLILGQTSSVLTFLEAVWTA